MAAETLPYRKELITPARVDERIGEQATEIIDRYHKTGQKVLFVTLLNGGVPYSSALMRKIVEQEPNFHPDLQYIRISRYGEAQEGSDAKSESKRLRLDAEYQSEVGSYDTIVLLDDLIDDGGTLDMAYKEMMSYGAQAVEAFVLGKKTKQVEELTAKLGHVGIGFDNLPDVWLTGMGMDDMGVAKEANRHYTGIAVATSQAKADDVVEAAVAAYELAA